MKSYGETDPLSGWTIALIILFLFAPLTAIASQAKKAEPQADRIVIVKSQRTMSLLRGDKVLRTYKVALGGQPVGPKEIQATYRAQSPGAKAIIEQGVRHRWKESPEPVLSCIARLLSERGRPPASA